MACGYGAELAGAGEGIDKAEGVAAGVALGVFCWPIEEGAGEEPFHLAGAAFETFCQMGLPGYELVAVELDVFEIFFFGDATDVGEVVLYWVDAGIANAVEVEFYGAIGGAGEVGFVAEEALAFLADGLAAVGDDCFVVRLAGLLVEDCAFSQGLHEEDVVQTIAADAEGGAGKGEAGLGVGPDEGRLGDGCAFELDVA